MTEALKLNTLAGVTDDPCEVIEMMRKASSDYLRRIDAFSEDNMDRLHRVLLINLYSHVTAPHSNGKEFIQRGFELDLVPFLNYDKLD